MIREVLRAPEFSCVGCAIHVALVNILKDFAPLDAEEAAYARNPLTHVDFLLFRKVDKSPLVAVEVDGTAFHAPGSAQAKRDQKKNRIFEKYGIPLLRLRTDGSGEEAAIRRELREMLPAAG